MFFYYFYALLTAPGVVIHELGHAVFCLLAGVKIRKIKLFQFGKVAGYVVHDEPTKLYESILVSYGPLIVNSLLTLICFAKLNFTRALWLSIILLWLGIAMALHSIPSTGDAKSLLTTINGRIFRNPFVIIGYPFVAVLYILNFLKRWHVHFLYALLLLWLGAWYLKGVKIPLIP